MSTTQGKKRYIPVGTRVKYRNIYAQQTSYTIRVNGINVHIIHEDIYIYTNIQCTNDHEIPFA